MFVALVGPDGAGKTTVASALERAAVASGRRFGYVHWLPSGRRPLSAVPRETAAPPPKLPAPVRVDRLDRLVSVMRLARNLVRFWWGYLVGIRRHMPGLRHPHTLLVADRWIYNYTVQPRSVAYVGSHRLAEMAVRAAPRPDLTVLLHAPAEVMVARKAELTVEETIDELARWQAMRCPNPMITVDGTASPEEVARMILSVLAGGDR
jgi:thymidylate kinase